jgi:hypothetical protein
LPIGGGGPSVQATKATPPNSTNYLLRSRSHLSTACEHLPAPRCVRPSLMLPAGETPAPARGRATPPGIEPWAYGGNDMS